MKPIIGLSGTKQSGKNTVGTAISHWYSMENCCTGEYEYSFADPLKEFLINTMGLTRDQCYGSDDDKNSETKYMWDNLPMHIRLNYSDEDLDVTLHENEETTFMALPRTGSMTAREMMQVFGTDIMREMFDDGIWVNATMLKIRNNNPDIAIITDTRFRSEVSAILGEQNAYIIRLTRSPNNQEDRHSSEIDLDGYDWSACGDRVLVIDNQNMTIEETNEKAIEFVKGIFEKMKVEANG